MFLIMRWDGVSIKTAAPIKFRKLEITYSMFFWKDLTFWDKMKELVHYGSIFAWCTGVSVLVNRVKAIVNKNM